VRTHHRGIFVDGSIFRQMFLVQTLRTRIQCRAEDRCLQGWCQGRNMTNDFRDITSCGFSKTGSSENILPLSSG
jgi:hypothetical protein